MKTLQSNQVIDSHLEYLSSDGCQSRSNRFRTIVLPSSYPHTGVQYTHKHSNKQTLYVRTFARSRKPVLEVVCSVNRRWRSYLPPPRPPLQQSAASNCWGPEQPPGVASTPSFGPFHLLSFTICISFLVSTTGD